MQSEGEPGDGDEGRCSPPPTSTQMPSSPSQQPGTSHLDPAGEKTDPTHQRPGGTPARTPDRPKRPCRVPGCNSDVSDLKSFNWRYRICEEHRSAASVVLDGIRMRFCQMCAKFHDLVEFQGRKMSCQKKLEDHNARRRVGALARDGHGSGKRANNDVRGYRSISDPHHSGSHSGEDPLPRVTNVVDPLQAALAVTLAQQQRAAGGGHGGMPQLGVPPQGMPPPLAWPSSGAGLMPQAKPTANQLLSAFLQLAHAGGGVGGGGGMPPGPQQFASRLQPQRQVALPPLPPQDNRNPLPHLLSSLAALAGASMEMKHAGGGSLPLPPQQQQFHASQPQDLPSNEKAAEIEAAAEAEAHNRGDGVEYASDSRLVRMSIKLFGCEPDALSSHVRSELDSLLDVAADQLEATGYLRPGCAHVTFDVRVPAGRLGGRQLGASDAVRVAEALLQRSGSYGPFVVQVGNEVGVGARPRPGKEEIMSEAAAAAASSSSSVMKSGSCEGMVPVLHPPEPRCVVAGRRMVVRLSGRGISRPTDLPLCRQRGCNVTLDVLGSSYDAAAAAEECSDGEFEDAGASAVELGLFLPSSSSPSPTMHPLESPKQQQKQEEAEEWVEVRPLGLLPGCAEIEVERGGALLSPAVPLLVLPDCQGAAAAAEEVRCGLAEAGWSGAVADQFLRDVGAVLQWQNSSVAGGGAEDAKLAALAAQLVSVCGNASWVSLSQLLKRA